MTDTQVIRKNISRNCVNSIEKTIEKRRLTQEEIQDIIASEVERAIRDEY